MGLPADVASESTQRVSRPAAGASPPSARNSIRTGERASTTGINCGFAGSHISSAFAPDT